MRGVCARWTLSFEPFSSAFSRPPIPSPVLCPRFLSALPVGQELEAQRSMLQQLKTELSKAPAAAGEPQAGVMTPAASAYTKRDLEQMSLRWGAEELDRVQEERSASPRSAAELAAENAQLRAQVERYRLAMQDLMVKSHEARLQAVAAERAAAEDQFRTKVPLVLCA